MKHPVLIPMVVLFSIFSFFPLSASETLSGFWWNDRVFYEIYVRAFQDSDGDGHGDLKGLISRLDYLNDGNANTSTDLGITGIWLMPVFDAQSQHGYDILDYKTIDKDYGTLEDFKLFIQEAHKRGIKVIVDLVLNHTSHNHPWFKSALSDPLGQFGNYYRFSEANPNSFWRSVINSQPPKFFYAWFNPTMPDLNYENPAVTQYILDATRFWLENTGVDGYRLDAIKYLIEEGVQDENTPSTHLWFKNFYKVVKASNPQAFTVGEVWDDLPTVLSYTGDEMDINFHFPLSSAIAESVSGGRANPLLKVLKETLTTFPKGQYATFLRNHDQKRLMNEFKGNLNQSLQAAAILLTLPGVPFLYYGEEIGLSLNRKGMQWDASSPNWGFTTGRVFSNGTQEKDAAFTVSAQTGDNKSLLSSYRRLIALRNSQPALLKGDITLVETGNPQVLAYLRSLGKQHFVVIHNLSEKTVIDYIIPLVNADGLTGKTSMLYPEEISSLDLKKDPMGFFTGKPLGELPGRSTHVFELK